MKDWDISVIARYYFLNKGILNIKEVLTILF